MSEGPTIAPLAALIGDPARANMLMALMDTRARTLSELAETAGVGLPTASAHAARMAEAGLLASIKQGRHRYFRLADDGVADLLERMMAFAQAKSGQRFRPGPRDAALRAARVCYDHLAGEAGVRLYAGLQQRGWLAGAALTDPGSAAIADLGIDVARLAGARRPLCRECLDWSERRMHLGGSLGAALLDLILARGWARRAEGRVVRFAPEGYAQLERALLLQATGQTS